MPRANRAGWASVVNDEVNELWGKHGVCAETYTSVVRSELHALVEVLRITAGPITVHVDSKIAVDGVAHGREWCCDTRREAADLWKLVWDRLDDMPGWVQVVKVKAHLTYQDALNGRIHWQRWIGNAVADQWAKAGFAAAHGLSPVTAFHSQWLRAKAW